MGSARWWWQLPPRRLLFHCADVFVSILWGDPVGESGGGGRAVRFGRRRVRGGRGMLYFTGSDSGGGADGGKDI